MFSISLGNEELFKEDNGGGGYVLKSELEELVQNCIKQNNCVTKSELTNTLADYLKFGSGTYDSSQILELRKLLMPNWDKGQTLYHQPGTYIIQADCWALIFSSVNVGANDFTYAYVYINDQQVVKGFQYQNNWSFESFNCVPVRNGDKLSIITTGPVVTLLPCYYEKSSTLYTQKA